MATRAQKIKVGLFLLTNVAIIVAGIVILSGFRGGEEIRYWIEFDESILGLGVGGLVEYVGVTVGRIEDISVTETSKARVIISLDPTKLSPEHRGLHQGVTAHLALYSLATGTMCVSLQGGDPGKPLLPPGSRIPAERSLFAAFGSQMGVLLENLSTVTQQIYTGFEGMKPGDLSRIVQHVDDLVQSGDDFLQTANETLEDVKDDAEHGLENFNRLSEELSQLAKNANDLIKSLNEKVAPLDLAGIQSDVRQQFKAVSESLQETAKTFETATRVVVNKTDNIEYTLRESLRSLTEALDALRELAVYLKEDPAAIIRGKGEPTGER
ncbi:MAG: MCE family protein [Candidatus Hydrogenedentes bacterium]|nr:MCE family protein [Candidatus Hydrogenedentota bacterium]